MFQADRRSSDLPYEILSFPDYSQSDLYVESNLRKVIIHTEKEAVEIYATMAELEQRLDSRFYRCHRGYLVNFEKVVKYDRKNIALSDGTNLILAKTDTQNLLTHTSIFKERFLTIVK